MDQTVDEDEDQEMIMSQAFEIPKIPADFDPNRPPTTGEEFLMHSIYQSRQQSKTVSVDIKSIKMKPKRNSKVQSCVPVKEKIDEAIPIEYRPTNDWIREKIEDFKNLCEHIEKLKDINTYQIDDTLKSKNLKNSFLKRKPTLDFITKISQNTLIELLDYINEKISDDSQIENANSIHLWIFAIFSQLESPYLPEMYALIRTIAVKYSQIRRRLCTRAAVDANVTTELNAVNLVIYLVVHFFKQFDLIDVNCLL